MSFFQGSYQSRLWLITILLISQAGSADPGAVSDRMVDRSIEHIVGRIARLTQEGTAVGTQEQSCLIVFLNRQSASHVSVGSSVSVLRERELWDSIPAHIGASDNGVRFRYSNDHWVDHRGRLSSRSGSMDIAWQSETGQVLVGTMSHGIDISANKTDIIWGYSKLVSEDGRIPSFVRFSGVEDFLPGRGWPTVLFSSLYMLKALGLEFGAARTATGLAANGGLDRQFAKLLGLTEANYDFHWTREDKSRWTELFPKTDVYRRLVAIFRISGHKVISFKITPKHRYGSDKFGVERLAGFPSFKIEWKLAPLLGESELPN